MENRSDRACLESKKGIATHYKTSEDDSKMPGVCVLWILCNYRFKHRRSRVFPLFHNYPYIAKADLCDASAVDDSSGGLCHAPI